MVIALHPIYNPSAGVDYLYRQFYHCVEELTKFHSEQFLTPLPTAHHKGKPRLQRPSQKAYNHIGPVGFQIPYRHAQGIQAVFELLNQILLIAAIITKTHHLSCRQIFSVGHVEKIATVVPQPDLPLFHRQFLPQHHDTIGLGAFGRLIGKLSNMLLLKLYVLVLFFHHNLLFDSQRADFQLHVPDSASHPGQKQIPPHLLYNGQRVP